MSELDCGCEASIRCRICGEVACVPHDINQPQCEHMRDFCAECRNWCPECRADRTDDERNVA